MSDRRALVIAMCALCSTARADTDDDYAVKMPALGSFIAVKDVVATSTFVDKSKRDLYGAWRTVQFEAGMEGFPKTAWCEGKPDEGIGEGITISLASPTKIDSLSIAAGVWLTQKLFDANNHVTSLALSFDGGPAIKVAPTAEREWLEVKVGKKVSSIKITIDKVAKHKMNDSCISGVSFAVGGQAVDAAVGLDAAAVAALPAAYTAMWNAFGDGAALAKLVTFPITYEHSDWFFNEGGGPPKKLQKLADAAALVAACKKKRLACPALPTLRFTDEAQSLYVTGRRNGVLLWFPSGRESQDQWELEWKSGAWKLVSIGYTAGNGP